MWDLVRPYWKWIVAITMLCGVVVLIAGLALYVEDYRPFAQLGGFAITARWVQGPRSGCSYNGKMFDCYDAYVLGNYTWSGFPHYCVIHVSNEFQQSEAQADLDQQFPKLGIYPMWSANPIVDNTCVRSVDSHSALIISGALLTIVAIIANIVAIIRYCLARRRATKRNLRALAQPPPPHIFTFGYAPQRRV
jgi:hypothetical protein